MMKILIRSLLVLGVLGCGGLAVASGEPPAHGAPATPHGEEEHAGGEHHVCYSCDADNDGTANWADSDSGESYAIPSLGFHAFNLALFIFVLVWFGGPTVRDSLRARAMSIRVDIDDAARLKAEAARRHDEVSARLGRLESEIAQLVEVARAEGQAEEKRIEQRAHETASRVAETAQRQIRDETARARQELRREAVELAVQLAEGILGGQVQPGDQRKLAAEFLTAVQHSSEGVSGHV